MGVTFGIINVIFGEIIEDNMTVGEESEGRVTVTETVDVTSVTDD